MHHGAVMVTLRVDVGSQIPNLAFQEKASGELKTCGMQLLGRASAPFFLELPLATASEVPGCGVHLHL